LDIFYYTKNEITDSMRARASLCGIRETYHRHN
jgi:hypothetical protein